MLIPEDDQDTSERPCFNKFAVGPGVTKADTEGSRTKNTDSLISLLWCSLIALPAMGQDELRVVAATDESEGSPLGVVGGKSVVL